MFMESDMILSMKEMWKRIFARDHVHLSDEHLKYLKVQPLQKKIIDATNPFVTRALQSQRRKTVALAPFLTFPYSRLLPDR